jgi:hypothetical protein
MVINDWEKGNKKALTPKELSQARHWLDTDDHRHKARRILQLMKHGWVQMKFDLFTIILHL